MPFIRNLLLYSTLLQKEQPIGNLVNFCHPMNTFVRIVGNLGTLNDWELIYSTVDIFESHVVSLFSYLDLPSKSS